jgi:hypothetical protein
VVHNEFSGYYLIKTQTHLVYESLWLLIFKEQCVKLVFLSQARKINVKHVNLQVSDNEGVSFVNAIRVKAIA